VCIADNVEKKHSSSKTKLKMGKRLCCSGGITRDWMEATKQLYLNPVLNKTHHKLCINLSSSFEGKPAIITNLLDLEKRLKLQ